MKLCPTCGTEFGDEQKFCPNDGSALRTSQQGDLVGSVIAERYHISKKLGEGGMGAVYLGEHVKMGRKSAIKVMSSSMAHDPEAIARFNREASNASRINHPNVCAIYDFGETPEGIIYLAMEFIEGGSLGNVLERDGSLPLHRAANILAQTADALQAAHDLGIVHRDLKPDNIMLTRGRDGGDLVKVVDFGIAKAMSGEEGQQVTKTGLVVGTPEYMSPEQLSGDKLDGRSDTYSLALVFYRMATGTFPFQATSAQEMMIKRLTDDPLPLGAARPDIVFPTALEEALRHALGRMPSERYATAVEFARDVSRAVAGMGAAATAAPAEAATQILSATSPDATVQLRPTRVGTAERAPASPRTPTTPQPRVSLTPPEKKKAPVAAIAAVVVVLGGAGVAAWTMLGGNPSGEQGLDTNATAAADSQAGGEPAAGDTGRTQTGGSQAGGQPQSGGTPGGGETPQPPVDSAAIASELSQIGDLILELSEGQAADRTVLTRLDAILADARVADNLRADAAFHAATAYVGAGNGALACDRLQRGLDVAPGNTRLRNVFTRLECR
jgi:serine/threonine-protein kinase